MRRAINVDLDELVMAFQADSHELRHYLDLETGEIIPIMDEFSRQLETIHEEICDPGGGLTISLEAYLDQHVPRKWQREMLLTTHRVEQEYGGRYVRIEKDDPHADYNDMERFIETLDDPRLQERLRRAIQGRGAFRYFKDVLYDYPDARQEWFRFRDARRRRRARQWLEARGIEPAS
ncbi:MAG: UPF0158 family protein [Chloroflexota bacterium]